MTAGELVQRLQALPPDMQVMYMEIGKNPEMYTTVHDLQILPVVRIIKKDDDFWKECKEGTPGQTIAITLW